MSWHVKKEDGSVYGPVDLDTLRHWAANGRIGPEDSVSPDGQTWSPAPEQTVLEMRWVIDLPDGRSYGPVHLLACRELLHEGDLPPGARLRHTQTGEQREAATAFADFPSPAAAAPAPADAGPARTVTWQAMAKEKDEFEREARRWKDLYEQIRARAETDSARAAERLRDREQDLIAAQSALDRAQQELAILRRELDELSRHVRENGGAALASAHVEVTRNFEALMNQYEARMAEWRETREIHDVRDAEFQARFQALEKEADYERDLARQAIRRQADTEASYLDLLRSFRTLNERFILSRAPAQPPSPAFEAPASASRSRAPALPKGFGPKVKLNR